MDIEKYVAQRLENLLVKKEITLAEFFTSPETIVGLTEEQKEFLCYLDDMNEDEKRFLKGLLQSLREKK